MAKRNAEYDLNRDNWDEDLPKDEAGTWKTATDEERKARPMIRAKRSLPSSASSSPVISSPFGAWSFGGATPGSPFSGIGLGSPSTKSAVATSEPEPTKQVSDGTDSSPAPSSHPRDSVVVEPKPETPPSNGAASVIVNKTPPVPEVQEKPQISPERRQALQDRRTQLHKAKARIEQELREIEQELGDQPADAVSNEMNIESDNP